MQVETHPQVEQEEARKSLLAPQYLGGERRKIIPSGGGGVGWIASGLGKEVMTGALPSRVSEKAD